jgi:hypothetical protein
MMNSKCTRAFLFVSRLAFCLMIAGCAVSTLDNGGSSGTEVSAVVGMVVGPDGNPVTNAVVRVRPVEYLADSAQSAAYVSAHTLFDTITGIDGSFSISQALPDSYSVEIVCDDTLGAFTQFRYGPELKPLRIPALRVLPLAQLSGTVQISYSTNAYGNIQVYGLDRTALADSFGNFSILLPQGSHKIHIGGYTKDSARPVEFDGMDMSFNVGWGEDKNLGYYYLKPPPPPPCIDGSCDSAIVRRILDAAGVPQGRMSEVTKAQNGRIVELNLRGCPLPNGIPPDVNKLVELRVLDLGQTGVPAMFPDMGRMTKLEIVRFDGDHLSMFSSSIGNCIALKELNLFGNELTALPLSIVSLNALTDLNVGNNRLCSVDSATGAWIDRYDPYWRTNQKCQ